MLFNFNNLGSGYQYKFRKKRRQIQLPRLLLVLFSCWVVSFFPIFYIQIPFITIHLGTLPGIQCFIEGDLNLISNGTASLIVILKFGNTF